MQEFLGSRIGKASRYVDGKTLLQKDLIEIPMLHNHDRFDIARSLGILFEPHLEISGQLWCGMDTCVKRRQLLPIFGLGLESVVIVKRIRGTRSIDGEVCWNEYLTIPLQFYAQCSRMHFNGQRQVQDQTSGAIQLHLELGLDLDAMSKHLRAEGNAFYILVRNEPVLQSVPLVLHRHEGLAELPKLIEVLPVSGSVKFAQGRPSGQVNVRGCCGVGSLPRRCCFPPS